MFGLAIKHDCLESIISVLRISSLVTCMVKLKLQNEKIERNRSSGSVDHFLNTEIDCLGQLEPC